jgi:peptidyl-prolyl cis-trans isomerase SDCCAG10
MVFCWNLCLSSNARKLEIEKVENEIRKLTKRRDGDDSDDEPAKKKVKTSYLEEELLKYSKMRGIYKKGKDGKKRDEGNVLAALNTFRGKLKSSGFGSVLAKDDAAPRDGDDGEHKVTGEEDPGLEVDDDTDFLGHMLSFPKDDGEESRKAERDYEVIDPRQRGARAKEEERERKLAAKAKAGGGRFRR